jgi:hypothetical protein
VNKGRRKKKRESKSEVRYNREKWINKKEGEGGGKREYKPASFDYSDLHVERRNIFGDRAVRF